METFVLWNKNPEVDDYDALKHEVKNSTGTSRKLTEELGSLKDTRCRELHTPPKSHNGLKKNKKRKFFDIDKYSNEKFQSIYDTEYLSLRKGHLKTN